jgi:hypothetical protein
MIFKPDPVVDFLLANQKVDHPNEIYHGKGKISFQLAYGTVHNASTIYICNMLDFVDQACSQEFKDKNKPGKHRAHDHWLES